MQSTTDLPIRISTPWDLLPARLRLSAPIDDDALLELCRANSALRIERAADGELLIMAPTGGEGGRQNAALLGQLFVWAERDGTGIVFDSSAGFSLSDGAMRAPDAAWIRRDRYDALPLALRRKFPRLCPDFVVELLSPTDRVKDVKAKMRAYIANGASLGWLIDAERRIVSVYREDGSVTEMQGPTTVSGDPVLPGFTLDLSRIF